MLIIFRYILGFFLQGFIFVFGVFTFNRQKVILKDYLTASLLVIICSSTARLLPITFGVHTIINMICIILICINLLKMSMLNTIRSTSIVMALSLVSEMIVLAVVSMILGIEGFKNTVLNKTQDALMGILVNIIFLALITLSYYLLKRKGDSNRKVSS